MRMVLFNMLTKAAVAGVLASCCFATALAKPHANFIYCFTPMDPSSSIRQKFQTFPGYNSC